MSTGSMQCDRMVSSSRFLVRMRCMPAFHTHRAASVVHQCKARTCARVVHPNRASAASSWFPFPIRVLQSDTHHPPAGSFLVFGLEVNLLGPTAIDIAERIGVVEADLVSRLTPASCSSIYAMHADAC